MRAMEYQLDLERYIISNGGGLEPAGSEDDYGGSNNPPIRITQHNRISNEDFYESETLEGIGLDAIDGKTDYLLGSVVIEEGNITLRFFNPRTGSDGYVVFYQGGGVVLQLEIESNTGEEPDRYTIDTLTQYFENLAIELGEASLGMPRITEYHGREQRTILFQTSYNRDRYWAIINDVYQ